MSESITVPTTGSQETTQTVSTEMNLDEGIQVMRVFMLYSSGFNIDRFRIAPMHPPAVEGDTELQSRLYVYPNPSAGPIRIDVELDGGRAHEGRIEIFDTLGRLVERKPILSNQVDLDLSEKANGLYHVLVVSDGKIAARRTLVVAH